MTQELKLQKFFRINHLREQKEEFDYLIAYGAPHYVLRLLLWRWSERTKTSMDAQIMTILLYAKREGLYEKRKAAIKARKSNRKFVLQRKGDSLDLYRRTFR